MEPVRMLHVAPTTGRQAERGRFETALRGAAGGVASAVAGSIAFAAPYVPGGPVLAGAVHGAVAAPLLAKTSAMPAASAPMTTAAAAATASGDPIEATRALQAEAQAFNLQYLQLQEALQRETREFTAVSNVLKVRHDAAKAAIQNIH